MENSSDAFLASITVLLLKIDFETPIWLEMPLMGRLYMKFCSTSRFDIIPLK